MRRGLLIFTLLFLSSCSSVHPRRPDPRTEPRTEPRTDQHPTARAILEASLAAHAPPPPLLTLTYQGTITVEGHFRRPHEARDTPVRATLTIAHDAGLARLDISTLADGRPRPPETTVIARGHAAYRATPDRPWAGPSAFLAPTVAAWTTSLDPRATLLAALQHPESAADHTAADAAWYTIDTTDDRALTRRLLIDRDTSLLVSITRTFEHPREGDVYDEVTYADYQTRSGLVLPTRITQRCSEEHHRWWATLTLADAAASDSIDPALFDAPPLDPEPPLSPVATVSPLFDRVWGVGLSTSNSRAFVLEFGTFLVCVEAPLDGPTGDALLGAIRSSWPDKPLRYVTFSHYHPHYTGGLRPFIAAGITVLTTPGNEAFVREVASRPFTISPDALARRAPVEPVIEVFQGSRVIDDGSFRAEFLDIGAASEHTDEFVATCIPSARAVLYGDLGAARADGTIAGRTRLLALSKACAERGLALDWFVQSWPLENYADKTDAAAVNAQTP